MAAQLGKEMLTENDSLQKENNQLQKQLDETCKVLFIYVFGKLNKHLNV